MKKWLLLAGLAAAAAYAAKKLLSVQTGDGAGAVTDVIFDEGDQGPQAPVETAEPPLTEAAPAPQIMEDMPGDIPETDENS